MFGNNNWSAMNSYDIGQLRKDVDYDLNKIDNKICELVSKIEILEIRVNKLEEENMRLRDVLDVNHFDY